MSDLLLKKYKDYIRLKNCRAEYKLSNGMAIDFVLLQLYKKGQTLCSEIKEE